MQLLDVSIDDKYTRESGRVFLSGTQALVRLHLMQRARDEAAGLNTAGFVSGYRGSPLGGLDLQIWKNLHLLDAAGVRFSPGLNEDLAATAVWGTQQAAALPEPLHDGVFAMWYGKGPGVDRSGDPLKHANHAGTSRHGGVLAVFGDDHPGKSSTLAHQSELSMAAFSIPVLYPATVQDYVDLGLHGWALSRYSGAWIGFKCVNETVENTASVLVDPDRSQPILPQDMADTPPGVHLHLHYAPQDDDVMVQRHRLPRALAYARANRLDRVTLASTRPRLGIVAAGKAYLDVLDALRLLGLDAAGADTLGISVYKVAMPWPLEPHGLSEFAAGLDEILFVEEKRPFMEDQAARILYNTAVERRPRIVGKCDENGTVMLPADVQIDAATVAAAIGARLERLGLADGELRACLADLRQRVERAGAVSGAPLSRTPYFCSGCPHNRSTIVPEGSIAMSGIGCHGMATLYRQDTAPPVHMGGEGATWIGASPFTKVPHVFQNLGDGTYSHSGLLAIRAALAAKLNITYKILYNDAVAMTGGQPVEGQLSVERITRQVEAEGVRAIAVISDEPDKYASRREFATSASVHHRQELERVQRRFRDTPGVTVIVYDQTCAAEKRRRRKRGQFPDPDRRAFINELVCEGCGDCSTVAGCVSIQPSDTEMGRKRSIDQSSCNKDFSCVEGFCPSFVSVVGGRLRRPSGAALEGQDSMPDLPPPPPAALEACYNIIINGIGGTGVVTIGAVLGMAAHLEGKGASVYDMTGLAQKGGAVFSHLKIAPEPEDIGATRIGIADAHLVLGCDLVVSAGKECLSTCRDGQTHAVVNTHLLPTAAFQGNPDLGLSTSAHTDAIRAAMGEERAHLVDATGIARLLLGDTIGANMFTVGYAAQKGLLPVSLEAIQRAIELNRVAVDFNLQALHLGRLAAHDAPAVSRLLDAGAPSAPVAQDDLDAFVDRRCLHLKDYQDEAYAGRYREVVDSVRRREHQLVPGAQALTRAVARYLFKVMAYKDEYEVARLYSDGRFQEALARQFDGDYHLRFHMAPPLLAARHPSTGLPAKREFGPWMLGVLGRLAGFKRLRGTPWDPFGYTAERRRERQIRDDYLRLVQRVLDGLDASNHDTAVRLAEIPELIRGFGHIKTRHLQQARQREKELMEEYLSQRPQASHTAASIES